MRFLFHSSLLIISIAILVGLGKSMRSEVEKESPAVRSIDRSESLRLSKRFVPQKTRTPRLWESPLIKKGLVVGVEHTYYDFMIEMDLNKEELTYFKSILNERILMSGTSQLKWATASHDSKTTISAALLRDLAENTAQIRKFLNHESDAEHFLRYESELPERQNLSPFLDALALNPRLEDRLFNLLQQARVKTEEAFGYEFESPTFLREHQDLELLKIMRAETDRKIESALPGILDSRQSQEFLNLWAEIREMQTKNSELTAKYVREEDS